MALASARIVHGFFFLAQLLGLDVQPAEPLPTGQDVQLTVDEAAALRRLIQRCKVAEVGSPVDHLLNAKAVELEATITSSLSSMSLQVQESTLKSQVQSMEPLAHLTVCSSSLTASAHSAAADQRVQSTPEAWKEALLSAGGGGCQHDQESSVQVSRWRHP